MTNYTIHVKELFHYEKYWNCYNFSISLPLILEAIVASNCQHSLPYDDLLCVLCRLWDKVLYLYVKKTHNDEFKKFPRFPFVLFIFLCPLRNPPCTSYHIHVKILSMSPIFKGCNRLDSCVEYFLFCYYCMCLMSMPNCETMNWDTKSVLPSPTKPGVQLSTVWLTDQTDWSLVRLLIGFWLDFVQPE